MKVSENGKIKKILFVTATVGGGGAERVLVNLANQMEQEGHEVAILATAGKNNNQSYNINKGIQIHSVEIKYKEKVKKICNKISQIRRVFREHKDYTIISFLPDVNMYTIVASMGLKNKVIISERNDPNREPTKKNMRTLRNILYNFADYVVFQTRDAQLYFSKFIQKKSCIIPNPINVGILPTYDYSVEKNNDIIMVCRVKPQKNIEMMIRAIDSIREELKDTKVKVYGDGNLYREQMKDMIKGLGLEKVISFEGPNADIYNVMKNAKIYISTSEYEGISNTMLEALAIGIPTIVTDCPIGGAKMFIRNYVNGILIPVNDYRAFGKAILEVLSNEDLQQKFSKESIKIREELDLKKIADMWLEVV